MSNLKVYLAGGMRGYDWREEVQQLYGGPNYLEPLNFSDPNTYTKLDLLLINQADAVLAYMSDDNPYGWALACEIGYALGLGKPVVFINALTDKRLPGWDFIKAATISVFTIQDGVYALRNVLKALR